MVHQGRAILFPAGVGLPGSRRNLSVNRQCKCIEKTLSLWIYFFQWFHRSHEGN